MGWQERQLDRESGFHRTAFFTSDELGIDLDPDLVAEVLAEYDVLSDTDRNPTAVALGINRDPKQRAEFERRRAEARPFVAQFVGWEEYMPSCGITLRTFMAPGVLGDGENRPLPIPGHSSMGGAKLARAEAWSD